MTEIRDRKCSEAAPGGVIRVTKQRHGNLRPIGPRPTNSKHQPEHEGRNHHPADNDESLAHRAMPPNAADSGTSATRRRADATCEPFALSPDRSSRCGAC